MIISPVMRKRYIIYLVGPKIWIKDVSSKIFEQINKLIKRNKQYLRLNKSEKRSMQDGILGYIKADT